MRAILFLIFTQLLLPAPLLASDLPSCGNKPNIFKSLVSNAKNVWDKCINDFYAEQKKLKDEEVAAIAASIQEIKKQLREIAYEYKQESNTVRCVSNKDEISSLGRTEKCRELVEAQRFLITRMDVLNGWDSKRAVASSASQATEQPEAALSGSKFPCPKGNDYEKYKAFRYFKRDLYKTWEQCEILSN